MERVQCMVMRGGTSKGIYFLNEDLPDDIEERDNLLLRIMGSPDPRQIDGIGGATPLTSKVAIVSREEDEINYLFLQVSVDEALVSDRQTCGNLLAGVGPFAIERGLWSIADGETEVPIRLANTGARAVAVVPTPGGVIEYDGDTAIDGVPGTASKIVLNFSDTAGKNGLLPTGHPIDVYDGVPVTCIDNGMPTVVINADSLGLKGDESPQALEADRELYDRIQRIRIEAGHAMGLGDVTDTTVPKMSIISASTAGDVNTRTFIPHRVHEAIGVLGAASVAASILISGTVGYREDLVGSDTVLVEHPTGAVEVGIELDGLEVKRTAQIRTARPIMDGVVFARPTL